MPAQAGAATGQARRRHARRAPGYTVTGRKVGFRGNKSALPSKTCMRCGRAMSWRRRWARTWAAVKYCSDACRRKGTARG